MFFDDDDERFLNQNLIHVVRRELYAITSNLDVSHYGLRSVPTHTEDGIPIRKLYVSNLPPKTTRTELFGLFAQYGFIKSCWLRMDDRGPNKSPTPTYAFITFSNPADAQKALQAPFHEKMLRGRNLRISPADSWHQPAGDGDERGAWKQRPQRRGADNDAPHDHDHDTLEASPGTSSNSEAGTSQASESANNQDADESDGELQYNILNILNRDCLHHVLTYVPIRDLIRSERVSKPWQNMVQEYLSSIRTFKTSWWQHVPVTLTTAVLRRLLARFGGALLRLYIDHHWSALNDRTAHTIGKFCPQLEHLEIVGMHTKNWNPLIYGCKNLKSLTFVSCNKLTDSSLVHLVKNESQVERLAVANNTHVTGLFLTGSGPSRLKALSFYNCYSLQGTVLSAAIDKLPHLTTLKLDVCPVSMWKIVPLILSKLPRLEELSLSEYTSMEMSPPASMESFCQSLAALSELTTLDLSRNIYITNAVLKQVAQSCPKLQSLNVSSCNSRKTFPTGVYVSPGVSDEGLGAVCAGCPWLRRLDASYLVGLSDAGLAGAARLPRLAALTARGAPALSAAAAIACLAACHELEELDMCGCDNVGDEVVVAAVRALDAWPRPFVLRLGGTAVASLEDLPRHKLLMVNITDDRSNPHLRPDFVDRIFDEGSEDSYEDLYDPDEYDDFLGPEDELFLDEDLEEDYENMYAYGLHAPDIILL